MKMRGAKAETNGSAKAGKVVSLLNEFETELSVRADPQLQLCVRRTRT